MLYSVQFRCSSGSLPDHLNLVCFNYINTTDRNNSVKSFAKKVKSIILPLFTRKLFIYQVYAYMIQGHIFFLQVSVQYSFIKSCHSMLHRMSSQHDDIFGVFDKPTKRL